MPNNTWWIYALRQENRYFVAYYQKTYNYFWYKFNFVFFLLCINIYFFLFVDFPHDSVCDTFIYFEKKCIWEMKQG